MGMKKTNTEETTNRIAGLGGGGGYALSDGGHHSVIWKLGVFIM